MRIQERKLVSIPTGDEILSLRWLSLTSQPLYSSAVDRLRKIELQIHEAQQSGGGAAVDALQSDRVDAETQLIRITERLHEELEELLAPSVRAFIIGNLNAIEGLIRWQSFLAATRHAVAATGFSQSALPFYPTLAAALSWDPKPILTVLASMAQAAGVITSSEALQLHSGKQIEFNLPQENVANGKAELNA
jgi:hypothetical protein